MRTRFLSSIIMLFLITGMLTACQPAAHLQDQSPAALTFRKNCQSCHRLPNPSDKSDEEWPALVQRYGEKAKLTPEKIAQISDWLIANN